MLGIHGVGRHRADYYLSDLGPELPAPEPGRWAGGAAAGLGLEGALGAADFHRLLQGRHPRTGQPIGSGRTTVAAFDLTFSAPKSVSVVFALGGEAAARRVVAAHIEAVDGCAVVPGAVRRHGRPPRGSRAVRDPHHRDGRRPIHPRRQPQRRPPPAQPRRHGERRARDGRPLERLRPTRDGGTSPGGVHGVRGALARRLDLRARRVLVRRAGPLDRDRGRGAAPPRRILHPGRRHPPAWARGRRALQAGRPCRLGRHPSGRSLRVRPMPTSWRSGNDGPAPPTGRSSSCSSRGAMSEGRRDEHGSTSTGSPACSA